MENIHRTTLAILLDSFRADYLSPEKTPYLWALKDQGVWGQYLFNPGGYCERTCFMTGAGPEKTDNYFAMALAPVGYKRSSWEPTFNVPMHIRERLAMTEDTIVDFEPHAFPVESFWDVMRENKKSFHFEACAALGIRQWKGRTTHGNRRVFTKDALKLHKDFYYVQVSEVDQYGHLYGTDSPEFHGILRWADWYVKDLVESAKKEFDQVNILVFGDHGMMNVIEKVDIPCSFHPFKEGWDYLYLKSSAAIQFWVFNEKVRNKILCDIPLNKYGRFIKSPSQRQGDIIWNAGPGILVSPCHFHGEADAPKAMHGYGMTKDEVLLAMRGMAIMVDGKHKGIKKDIDLRDICPTVCDMVGIRHPEHNEGVSLCTQHGKTK